MKNTNNNDLRNRRRKLNKKRKRINYFRLFILIVIFILFIFLTILGIKKLKSYFFKKEEKVYSTKQEVLEFEKDKDKNKIKNEGMKIILKEKTKNKIDKINKELLKSNKILNTRIEKYFKENNIDKKDIGISYKSLNDNKKLEYYSDITIPMRDNDVFILSMLVEDLTKEKKININENLEISKYEKLKQKKYISIQKLIRDIITDSKEWKINLVKEKIKEVTKLDWKLYANKKYKININEDNEINFKDLTKVLTLMMKKEKSEYTYINSANAFIENGMNLQDKNIISNPKFIGLIMESGYGYNIELGFVLDKNPYIYIIYSGYTDSKYNNDLRNILNEWVNEYEIN